MLELHGVIKKLRLNFTKRFIYATQMILLFRSGTNNTATLISAILTKFHGVLSKPEIKISYQMYKNTAGTEMEIKSSVVN